MSMAGVAGPAWRRNHSAARRFLLGFAIGEALSAVILGSVMLVAGTVAAALMSDYLRWGLFAVGSLILGVADFFDHTPQWPRQVPKQLSVRLRPFGLGTVWGIDLGLLVTTRKVSSVTWIAMLGVVLLSPSGALPLLVGCVCGSVGVLVYRSVMQGVRRVHLSNHVRTVTMIRLLSGALGVAAGALGPLLYVALHP
jgi:hypothetical protein